MSTETAEKTEEKATALEAPSEGAEVEADGNGKRGRRKLPGAVRGGLL